MPWLLTCCIEYETKIVALERMVGRQALEIEFLKGGAEKRRRGRGSRDSHPSLQARRRAPIAEGCRRTGIARSTFATVGPSTGSGR